MRRTRAQTGDVVALPDDEAAASHARAAAEGRAPRSACSTGAAHEFDARRRARGRRRGVRCASASAREAAPEPRVAVTLAQAVLKGDKMDDVVRDAVMMGVAAIQPMVTARSEVTLPSLTRGRRRERWDRIAVSSAKQCGRAVVPAILEPLSFEATVASLSALTLPEPCLMFVEPGGAVAATPIGELDPVPPRQATILAGPEGGWTPDEIERGAAVARQVTLGGRTLRADAMATVALTALFTLWRDF